MDYKFYTVRGFEQKLGDTKLMTGTMEDYLEMIYRCYSGGENYIRLNKLSSLLNVKDSTASKMMGKLKELKLVDYERYGIIELTSLGIEIGKYLYERHNIVEKFLEFLCDSEEAFIETELIEHSLSAKTVENIDLLNKFIEENEEMKVKFNEFREQYKE